MPPMVLDPTELVKFGAAWRAAGDRFDDKAHTGHASPNALGHLIDKTLAEALAAMLGGIPIHQASRKKKTQLYPPEPDCVETAPVVIVGGIRKQSYDVAYRPDGVRFAADSKTLNDQKSVGKNWQNMVNDLATEAATVHTRFPLAVVAFFVLIPEPAIGGALDPITWRLDGLGARTDEHAPSHVAEAMCFALWDPDTGLVSPTLPDPAEHPNLRIENFSAQIEDAYRMRYSGSPPH
jgi:hypothetical protein